MREISISYGWHEDFSGTGSLTGKAWNGGTPISPATHRWPGKRRCVGDLKVSWLRLTTRSELIEDVRRIVVGGLRDRA